VFYIYNKFAGFTSSVADFKKLEWSSSSILFILIAFVLMVVNWLIESKKWQFLISKQQTINFLDALKGVLAGISVSIFTPNRTGETIGRMVVLTPENRIKSILLTLIGNYAQLLTTLVGGLIGFALLITSYNYSFESSYIISNKYLIYFLFALSIILPFIYFNIRKLSEIINYVFKSEKVKSFFSVVNKFDTQDLSIVLTYSLIRYVIFFIQFYFLSISISSSMVFSEYFIVLSVSFFVMNFIPTFSIAELGVRSSVMLYFGEIMQLNPIVLILASALLWIINLAVPSLFGYYIILKARL
jgi:uncharacterized membrane protein YbhN (UPF0104 family)